MGEKYPKKIILFLKNYLARKQLRVFFIFYKGICDVAAKVAIIHKTI
jgi:hypothetical protein